MTRGVCLHGGLPPGGFAFKGVYIQEGLCPWELGRLDMVNKQAVHILPECILADFSFGYEILLD